MALALEARAMKDDILIGDTPKAKRRRQRVKSVPARGRLWKHSRLSDLDGYLGPEQLSDYFIFTLVRNPWDRMVSYYHWLRVQTWDHRAVELAREHGFADFIAHPETARSLANDVARKYVEDADGVERCDAYVRLERLEEDLQPVARHLAFDLEVPRANTSAREADYRSYYDDTTAERVSSAYAEDIARFGYEF